MSDEKFRVHLLQIILQTVISYFPDLAQTHKQLGTCHFPEKWEGTWFQSGVREPILIEGARLSSKGRCLSSEGDKFLVVDDKGVCYRCVVIHEKHPNVLQYKETFCHGKGSLGTLCGLITGDALLYSMFREDALPVACPFRGPFTFTYNRGHGECRNPVSSVDACTEDSRLLLSYQACPDVYGSESIVEELQCLAMWKEGSSRYLVGKVHHNHATSNEDRFRCFVYEKASSGLAFTINERMGGAQIAATTNANTNPNQPPIDYRVAQSGDATCNGLFSPTEGSRTMTFRRAPTLNKCRFPAWLSAYQLWHSLDHAITYNFHHRNSTLKITNTSGLEMKVICVQIKDGDALPSSKRRAIQQESVIVLAHFTMGCQSGYMCLNMIKRDVNVIEVQIGEHVKRQEDACTSTHFNTSIPFITLVSQSLEPKPCPYTGKYTISGLVRTNQKRRSLRSVNHVVVVSPTTTTTTTVTSSSNNLAQTNQSSLINYVARRRVRRLHQDRAQQNACADKQFTALVFGCNAPDTMEFHTECTSALDDVISSYTCHGGWEENGTNYLITTPVSRASHGAKRFCFIYRDAPPYVLFSSSSGNCDRHIQLGVHGTLAFNVTNNGKCEQVNAGEFSSKPTIFNMCLIFSLALIFR